MQNRQIFSTKLPFITVILYCLLTMATPAFAGSVMNWHKITNGSQEQIVLSFYEGYPVNEVHSRLLKPGQSFEVKNTVERPGSFYLITIIRNPKDKWSNQIIINKMFTWHDLNVRYQADQKDGIYITEKDFEAWDKLPQ